jgi:hypothetical protein
LGVVADHLAECDLNANEPVVGLGREGRAWPGDPSNGLWRRSGRGHQRSRGVPPAGSWTGTRRKRLVAANEKQPNAGDDLHRNGYRHSVRNASRLGLGMQLAKRWSCLIQCSVSPKRLYDLFCTKTACFVDPLFGSHRTHVWPVLAKRPRYLSRRGTICSYRGVISEGFTSSLP